MTKLARTLLGGGAIIYFMIQPVPIAAQATGDGWQGPHVFNGRVLDESLIALNVDLQARYAYEDAVAALYPEPATDFVAVASAVSNVPEMAIRMADAGFGIPVSDDRTLMDSLMVFNTDVATRGDDLFLQIAFAESGKAMTFDEVAQITATHPEAELLLARLSGAGAFGAAISDDETLQTNLAGLADKIFEFEAREERLAFAVPAITGDSFDTYVIALAY